MSEREIKAVIRRCDRFTDATIASMFALHKSYFANVSSDKFRSDFDKKQWCVILSANDGTLAGYSTIELLFRKNETVPLLVLFSGDTLVAREYRSANALIPAFVQFTAYLADRYPAHARYWLLITKGYRTYRLLTAHFHEFYPTFRYPTPQMIKTLVDSLCQDKFGTRYDEVTGIINTDAAEDFLLPENADVPPGRERNPDVNYFLRANPGYRHGDELACITRLDKENLHASWYRRYIDNHPIPIEE